MPPLRGAGQAAGGGKATLAAAMAAPLIGKLTSLFKYAILPKINRIRKGVA